MHNSTFINEIPLQEWQKLIGSIVQKLAKSFGYAELEDLEQEAWPVIYHAATRFNPKKNTKFTTYVSTCLIRHLYKYLAKKHQNTKIEIENESSIEDFRKNDDQTREVLTQLLEEEPLLKAYFAEGKTYQQIAEEKNQPVSKTYKQVKLAIKEAKIKFENH